MGFITTPAATPPIDARMKVGELRTFKVLAPDFAQWST
jgi:hypothetical protein